MRSLGGRVGGGSLTVVGGMVASLEEEEEEERDEEREDGSEGRGLAGADLRRVGGAGVWVGFL